MLASMATLLYCSMNTRSTFSADTSRFKNFKNTTLLRNSTIRRTKFTIDSLMCVVAAKYCSCIFRVYIYYRVLVFHTMTYTFSSLANTHLISNNQLPDSPTHHTLVFDLKPISFPSQRLYVRWSHQTVVNHRIVAFRGQEDKLRVIQKERPSLEGPRRRGNHRKQGIIQSIVIHPGQSQGAEEDSVLEQSVSPIVTLNPPRLPKIRTFA